MQTKEELEKLYGESALRVLPGLWAPEDVEGEGKGASRGKNEWDAKTLVGGSEGIVSRDDETLRGGGGDDDERGAVRRG